MKDKYATPDFLCSSCGSTGVFRPLGMEDYTHLEGHYPCKAYNELLNSGWRKVEYKTSTRGGTVTDALYMNYPEPAELHDYRFLGKDRIDRQRIKRKINGKVRQLLGLPQLERNAILQAMMNLSAHPPLEKNGKVS